MCRLRSGLFPSFVWSDERGKKVPRRRHDTGKSLVPTNLPGLERRARVCAREEGLFGRIRGYPSIQSLKAGKKKRNRDATDTALSVQTNLPGIL